MKIGEKIHQLRKLRKITLMELSKASGVAQATLSRIENDIMTGTVESHARIAEALGVTLPELYSDVNLTQKDIIFQKSGDTTNTFLHGEHTKAVILTKNALRKKMLPVLLEMQPKITAPLEQNSPDTEKFIYCLEGEIEAAIDEQVFELEVGDSIYFNASSKHGVANKTNSLAKCLVFSSPPAL